MSRLRASSGRPVRAFHLWLADDREPVAGTDKAEQCETIARFAESNNRMLLYSEQIVEGGVYTKQQSVSAFGPPEFQREMAERASAGEKLS